MLILNESSVKCSIESWNLSESKYALTFHTVMAKRGWNEPDLKTVFRQRLSEELQNPNPCSDQRRHHIYPVKRVEYVAGAFTGLPKAHVEAFMELTLCTGEQSFWNRKGPSPNCFHKARSIQLSKMTLYALALTLRFTGAKGPQTLKNTTAKLYGTIHSGK